MEVYDLQDVEEISITHSPNSYRVIVHVLHVLHAIGPVWLILESCSMYN